MEKINKNQVTIDDVAYDFEDMKPEQQAMVNHLADLDKKLGSMQFNMEQLQVGREAFIKMLSDSLTAPAEAIQ